MRPSMLGHGFGKLLNEEKGGGMRMKIKTERSVAAFSLRALRGFCGIAFAALLLALAPAAFGAEEAGLLDEARGTVPSAEESTN